MKSRKFTLKDYSSLALVMLLGNKIGNAQVVYTDLDPDLELQMEFIDVNLDLDNDLNFDFKIIKESISTFNTEDIICYSNRLFEMGTLGNDNYIVGESITFGKDIVLGLNFGYLINESAQFNSDGWQYVTKKRQELSCDYPYPAIEPWVYFNLGGWFTHQDEDQYIGVKFKNDAANCYYYGWIRCVISDSLEKITIKDYAYNSNCGGGIQAGMLTSSINEPIVPEPIIVVQYEMLNIAVTGSYMGSTIDITNMLGQILKKATISAAATQINLNGLAAGIYLVSVKKDEQTYVKKIVVN